MDQPHGVVKLRRVSPVSHEHIVGGLNNTPFPEPAERAIDPSQYAASPAFSFFKLLRYFRAQLLTIRWCLGIIIGGALEGPR